MAIIWPYRKEAADLPDYKALYFHLFGRLADAVAAVEAEDYRKAAEILIGSMQEAEEQFLNEGGAE